MKYTCATCEHHEQSMEDGPWICLNRDSDLWNMETGMDDTCLSYEPKGDSDDHT